MLGSAHRELARPRAFGVVIVSTLAVAMLSQACTIASPTYIEPVEQKAAKKKKDAGADSTDTTGSGLTATCGTDDFIKPDLSTLAPCGGGKGHCFDKTKTPMGDKLTACPGSDTDVCVPDNILEAGGAKVKQCKAIIGDGGGCAVIDLIPEMKERGGSALGQGSCDAGEVCAPCIDPTNNDAPTGMCEPTGVHENACTGGDDAPATPSAPCCTMNGRSLGMCIPESGVPEGERDSTVQDSCSAGNKCVPAAMATGKPVLCTGGLLGNAVCMGKCFNDMLALVGDIGFLSQDTCSADELCIPCAFMPGGVTVPGCE